MFEQGYDNWKGLTVDEELIFEKNITWLFGNARGGTSWVALQLLSYQTNAINEPHIDEFLSMRANEIKDKIVRRIDNPQKNPDYFFSEKYKKVWMIFLKKLILNRFYAQTQDISKKTIIKELSFFGATEIISSCMNKSKIIILLRDGRDVIDSILAARGTLGFMTKAMNLQPIQSKQKFIENHSIGWNIRTNNFLQTYANHSKNLRYLVKYEDLRKNTFEELEKIYKFLEIDIPKDELEKIVDKYSFENIPEKNKGEGKFTRSASPGKWKESFTDEEKTIMEKIMGDTLRKIGYE